MHSSKEEKFFFTNDNTHEVFVETYNVCPSPPPPPKKKMQSNIDN